MVWDLQMRYGINIKYTHTIGELVRDLKVDFGISKKEILSILYLKKIVSSKNKNYFLKNFKYIKSTVNDNENKYCVRSKVLKNNPYDFVKFYCDEHRFFINYSDKDRTYAHVGSRCVYPDVRFNLFHSKIFHGFRISTKEREYFNYLDALTLVNFRVNFDMVIEDVKNKKIEDKKEEERNKIFDNFEPSRKHGLNEYYWDYKLEKDNDIKNIKFDAYQAYLEYYKTMHLLNYFNSKRKKL